jgi:hypothetical protein
VDGDGMRRFLGLFLFGANCISAAVNLLSGSPIVAAVNGFAAGVLLVMLSDERLP